MRIIIQILMAVSAICLILSGLYWVNIIQRDLLGVSGQGFLWASIACAVYAMALEVTKPCGNRGGTGN